MMETRSCTKCKVSVSLDNCFVCKNDHLLCGKCIAKAYTECPNCHADWKQTSDENEKINDLNEQSGHMVAQSSSYTLLQESCHQNSQDNSITNPEMFLYISHTNGTNSDGSKETGHMTARLSPKCKQLDYNKMYGIEFVNEDEKKLFEAMNSTSGEKPKVQVHLTRKSLSNSTYNSTIGSRGSKSQQNTQNIRGYDYPSIQNDNSSLYRNPSVKASNNLNCPGNSGSATDLNSQKGSDTGSRRVKPSSTVNLVLRQQLKEMFCSDSKRNINDEGVFMVTGQPQKPEPKFSLRVASQKELHLRNANLNTAVKIINQKEGECSKQRRLKREQLIAEEKTVLRQKILEDMQNKLLQQGPNNKQSSTLTFTDARVPTPHFADDVKTGVPKEDEIKFGSHRGEKANKLRSKRVQEVKLRPDSYSSTSEIKSSQSEKPCIDSRTVKKPPYPRDSSPGFESPRILNQSDSRYTSSESSPRPVYKFAQQRKYNIEDNFSKDPGKVPVESTKCLKIDTATSPRTDSSIKSPSWEMKVVSPKSERDYDKYGNPKFQKTGSRNFKDSGTEPISDFDSDKLYCKCSCEKIPSSSNKEVQNKSSQTEIIQLATIKSNPSFHFTSDSVETSKSKSETECRKFAEGNNKHRDHSPSEKYCEKSSNIELNKKKLIEAGDKEDEKPNRSNDMDSQNNIDLSSLDIGDHFTLEKDLDKVLESFIKLLLKKNPKMTLTNIQDVLYSLSDNDTTSQSKLSKNSTDEGEVVSPKAYNDDDDSISVDAVTKISSFKVTNRLTNAWQAFCRPPDETSLEPLPQIRMVQIRYVNDEILRLQETQSIFKLNVNRNPLNCPISTCKKKVFISEFTKHIKLNHVRIAIETISPGVCRNLFFDCKLVRQGLSTCQILYLVTNKICDFGSHEFRDYLPVLLMTTKISLLELICSAYQPRDEDILKTKQYYYFIWLTGLVIKELPVYYTIVAWNRTNIKQPKCHLVNSGKLYSFREDQNAVELYKTGQALILSQKQCDLLTDNGKNMMELQVILH